MCLIVLKDSTREANAGANFKSEYFRNAATKNADGIGMMFVGDGRLQIDRAIGSLTQQQDFYKKYRNQPKFGLHLRWGTKGLKDVNNCHPFSILTKEEDGIDLAVMHNGVIQRYGPELDKDYSDTWHYVENFLKPILKAQPDLIHLPSFQAMIKDYIGSNNKLVFMDSENRDVIINHNVAGTEWKDGCWLSNTYSIAGPVITQPYVRHYSSYNKTPYVPRAEGQVWDAALSKWVNPPKTALEVVREEEDVASKASNFLSSDGKPLTRKERKARNRLVNLFANSYDSRYEEIDKENEEVGDSCCTIEHIGDDTTSKIQALEDMMDVLMNYDDSQLIKYLQNENDTCCNIVCHIYIDVKTASKFDSATPERQLAMLRDALNEYGSSYKEAAIGV